MIPSKKFTPQHISDYATPTTSDFGESVVPVLADAAAAALLAPAAPPPVLAEAAAAALLALAALPPMLADANAAALLAPVALPPVRTLRRHSEHDIRAR